MTARWERVETMLNNSQRVRDELANAVGKLDSYIDLLKVELAHRDAPPVEGSADDEPCG